MKKIYMYLLPVLLCIAGLQTSAQVQVIDLSTGIDANGNLIAFSSPDDTWTVRIPGAPSDSPVFCGKANLVGWYQGLDPSVRWLSPWVNASGVPTGRPPSGKSVPGDYTYRMTFQHNLCEVNSAVLNFVTIGGDDYVYEIRVNGNPHNGFSYGFQPLASGVTIPLGNGEINVGQVNMIEVMVHDFGTVTGLELNGNLTLTGIGPPNASFSLTTSNNTTVHGTGSATGNHTWEVYSSSTGNQGTYNHISTVNFTELHLFASAGSGPCYLVKHTVTNECGTACESQSICRLSCDNAECGVNPPGNLQYAADGTLTWDPVAGAVGYVITLFPNDPACCGGGIVIGNPDGLSQTWDSYPVEIMANEPGFNVAAYLASQGRSGCFSWRVRAICANGTLSAPSMSKCENSFGDWYGPGHGMGVKGQTTGMKDGNNKEWQVNIFPNPTKGMVSFVFETDNDVDVTVSVIDINGKTVKTFDHVKTSQKKAEITWNTESLSKGIYLVKASTSDKQVINKKLIIE